MDRQFIHLHVSEGYILRSAAGIYSGYIASGAVNAGSEEALASKAVDLAIHMARLIDERVQCQDEID